MALGDVFLKPIRIFRGIHMINPVSQFFEQGWICSDLNFVNATLILKQHEAHSIKHYKQLTLTNFYFKVIIKIIVDMVTILVPKFVLEHQRILSRQNSLFFPSRET